MSGGVVQDAFVCDLKAGEQKRLHVRIGSFGENLLDGIDRDATGLLSTFVPAHAVGYNRQPALAGEFLVGGRLPVSELVFIVFSLAADVAHAGQLNSRPYSHHTSHIVLEQTKNGSSVIGMQSEIRSGSAPLKTKRPETLGRDIGSDLCRSLTNLGLYRTLTIYLSESRACYAIRTKGVARE